MRAILAAILLSMAAMAKKKGGRAWVNCSRCGGNKQEWRNGDWQKCSACNGSGGKWVNE